MWEMESLGNNTAQASVGWNNTAQTSVGWIPPCVETLERDDNLGFFLAGLNFISVLANLLHIVILSKMPSLRGSAYYLILVHLSLADIHYALNVITHMTWNRPSYFENVSFAAVLIYDVLLGTSTNNRFMLMLAASLERYIAICQPMKYSTSKYVSHLHIWLVVCWLLSYLLSCLKTGLSYRRLCFYSLRGPSLEQGMEAGLISLVLKILPALISGVFLVRVMKELKRMGKNNPTQEMAQLRRATRYLITVFVIFYGCLISPIIAFSLFIAKVTSPNTFGYYLFYELFNSLYGCLNIVIYGWMTPAYRARGWQLVRCKGNGIGDGTGSGVAGRTNTVGTTTV